MPARRRLLPILVLVSTAMGCAALNYPSDGADTDAAGGSGAPPAPVLLEIGSSEEEAVEIAASAETDTDAARTWYELTRAARLARQTGDFDEGRERLAQAAMQLEGRPASDSARRAVHGMRARLALDFVALRREEDAEALAEILFEEARAEPSIGGPATVELVQHFAAKRAAKARASGLGESQLPLLRIAVDAAEQDSPSLQRLELTYEISQTASREGDDALARRAIELALSDARTVQASDKAQIASLEMYRARIARSQGDLAVAESAVTTANRLFDAIDAPPSNRAVAEATLAAILAERGQADRARAIAQGALARIDQTPPLSAHAVRTVLAEAGRMERDLGAPEAARELFERALEIPGLDFGPDEALVERLTRELAALEERPARPVGREAASEAGREAPEAASE